MDSKWPLTRLDEAFSINPSRTIRRGEESPFLPMDALVEYQREPSRIERRVFAGSGARFQNGDTLLARITPCLENGKTAFVSNLPDGTVGHGSTEFIVLSGKEGVSDSLFVYYWARSAEFRRYAIAHMEGTSGRQRVPADAVARFTLPLPPLAEQRGISEILCSLDDKIELNRHTNRALEETARAIFRSWFVDFDPVRAKAAGRQPVGTDAETAALFPDAFVDSELGPIPAGWDVCGLDQIATFLNGLALQKFPQTGGEWLPAIRIAQLRQGHSTGADRVGAHVPTDYVVNDGDVLFSWSGTLEARIWCGGHGALNQHLFKVSSDRFPKWFYFHWILQHLPSFREIAASKATTMGHIQRHHLSQAKVIVPDQATLKAAERMIAPLVDKTLTNDLELRTLSDMRDALLPKLLSGELRVPVAEEMLAGATA